MTRPPSILIVEDEAILALDLEAALVGLGYEVCGAVASGEEAVESAVALTPSLILMDVRLQGEMDGIQAAASIRSQLDVPVVYLTAHSEEDMLRRAKETDPFGYLIKPHRRRDLHVAIEIALRKHHLERALRERELWVQTMLRSIGDAVVAVDASGAITYRNPAAAALFPEAEPGERVEPHLPFVDIFRLATAEEPIHGSATLEDGKGEPRIVDYTLSPLVSDAAARTGSIATLRDVSDRVRAERWVQARAARFRALFDLAGVGIALVTSQAHIVEGNRALVDMLGCSMDELRGRAFWDLSPSEDAAVERRLFQELVSRDSDGYRAEVRHFRKEGLMAWCQVSMTRLPSEPGLFIRILSDVSHERLEQVVAFQETERAIVACELHDAVSQPLTAAYYRLQAAEHRISSEGDDGPALEDVAAARQTIQHLLDQMSNVIADLRTPVLDGENLFAALGYLVNGLRGESGLGVHLKVPTQPPAVSPVSAFTVYRIIQEALRNVARHAGPCAPHVEIEARGGILSAVVRDDGAGFDSAEVAGRAGAGRRRHLGLRGMKERAELIGGRLSVETEPGRGTRVHVEVPLGVCVE